MAATGARAVRDDDEDLAHDPSPAAGRSGKRGRAADRGGEEEEVDVMALPESVRVHRGRMECGRFNGREWVALS